MSASRPCPWCGEPYVDPDAVCDGCMRAPAQHPSYRADADAGLSLELDAAPAPPRVSAAPKPKAKPAAPASLPAVETAGADDLGALADWDDPGGSLDIALDLGSVPPPGMSQEPPPPSSGPPSGGARPAAAVGGASLAPAEPAQVVVAVADPRAEEIRAIAGYGPEPTHWSQLPVYALRVFRRRSALRADLRAREQRHAAEARALHERLAREVDAMAARDPDAMAPIMAPIAQVDARVAQLSALEAQSVQAEEAARMAEQQAEMRKKRAHQEVALLRDRLKKAHEDAAQSAGGAAYATPEDARRIAGLEVELKNAQAEAQRADRALSEARKAVAGAARGARTAALQAASGPGRDDKLAAYLRALERVERELPQLVEPEQRTAIDELRATLATREEELDKHRRAVDAYHAPSFKQGLGFAVAAGVVLLLVLVSIARVG